MFLKYYKKRLNWFFHSVVTKFQTVWKIVSEVVTFPLPRKLYESSIKSSGLLCCNSLKTGRTCENILSKDNFLIPGIFCLTLVLISTETTSLESLISCWLYSCPHDTNGKPAFCLMESGYLQKSQFCCDTNQQTKDKNQPMNIENKDFNFILCQLSTIW